MKPAPRAIAVLLIAASIGRSIASVSSGPTKRRSPTPTAAAPALPVLAKWTGDLDGMVQRRTIRAFVVSSKKFYSIDRGQQRGMTYDALVFFEKYLNEKL